MQEQQQPQQQEQIQDQKHNSLQPDQNKKSFQNQKSSIKKSFKGSTRGKGNLAQFVDYKKSIRNSQYGSTAKKSVKHDKQSVTIKEILKTDNTQGGFEDGRETNALFSDYLVIEVACSCLNLLGVCVAVLEFDLEYNERNLDISETLCYVITVTSIISIILTFLRFQANLDWMIARKVVGKNETLFSTGLIWSTVFEMLLVIVGPLPWTVNKRIYFDCEPAGATDLYYHVNEILSLVLMLRGLLIFRTFLMVSQWYNNRSQRVCKLYACNSDLLFVIKCIMKQSPYQIVSFVFFVSIFYFGFLIRVCEAPLAREPDNQNFLSYYNALWNIIITMTTVGYGDYYPQTHLGRFIIFIVSIWGVFVVSIMVVTMTTTLETSSLENKAIAVLDRLFVREQLRNSASTVLTTVGKISLQNSKTKRTNIPLNEKEQNKLIVKLRNSVNEYKRIHRHYRSICDDNISEEMSRQFDFMREEFSGLYEKQQIVLEANVEIMKHLKMDQNKIAKFEDIVAKQAINQDDVLSDAEYEKDLQKVGQPLQKAHEIAFEEPLKNSNQQQFQTPLNKLKAE